MLFRIAKFQYTLSILNERLMNEQEFHDKVDALFLLIEQWLESADTMLDFETEQGILTIFLAKGAQIILSRQAPLKEIWLATPHGAYHFQYEGQWQTKQGLTLIAQLQASIKQETQIDLDLGYFKNEEY